MDFERHYYVRNRDRSLSCSDKMWDEIRFATKDTIPVSAFIRRAVRNELKRMEDSNGTNKSTDMD